MRKNMILFLSALLAICFAGCAKKPIRPKKPLSAIAQYKKNLKGTWYTVKCEKVGDKSSYREIVAFRGFKKKQKESTFKISKITFNSKDCSAAASKPSLVEKGTYQILKAVSFTLPATSTKKSVKGKKAKGVWVVSFSNDGATTFSSVLIHKIKMGSKKSKKPVSVLYILPVKKSIEKAPLKVNEQNIAIQFVKAKNIKKALPKIGKVLKAVAKAKAAKEKKKSTKKKKK